MSKLPVLPKAPEGVQLGLKCPQSVLFLDLTYRGNSLSVFRKVYGIDYAPSYIAYDATEKSWNFTNNEFNRQISPELKADVVAQKFITTTTRTARQLLRTAQILSSPARWRKSHLKQDLLEDLNIYWDAFEEHTLCSYVFWGVEHLIMNCLVDALGEAGLQEEVDNGLPSFVVPSEPNWFTSEDQHLAVLKPRFKGLYDEETTLNVATFHANIFGAVSTPYQLGTRPSGADIIARLKQPIASAKIDIKLLDAFPEYIARLGELVRELAFWKSERIDTYAVADHYAAPMYRAAADLIGLRLELVFCMTRDELTEAINGNRQVSNETLEERKENYCLALIDGDISFYQPTVEAPKQDTSAAQSGDVFQGLPTSPGVVRGRVRILAMGENNPVLEPDEIIVTSMTRPELGAALDVALAYVTDEGGRLCHAAIVSREKGKPCVTGVRLSHATIVSRQKAKPCVVGTREATRVLKNGMLIEVDGTKGTVTVV